MPRTLISFDYAMKTVLRDPSNFDILSGFLTELFEKKVEVQALIESESASEVKYGKINRVDMKVQIEGKEIVVVELQYLDQLDFYQRILFGVSKAVVEQIGSGQEYGKIKKVYSVDITYFDIGSDTDYLFHGKTELVGVHSKEVLKLSKEQRAKYKKGTIAGLYPEYFLINTRNFNDEIKNRFDEWVYVLKNSTTKDNFKAAGIKSASKKLDYLKLSPEAKLRYDRDLDRRLNWESAIRTKIDKARSDGELAGEARGRQEGELAGEARGRHEGETRKAQEIARKLKAEGVAVSIIIATTGLSESEIKAL
ncbi:hypothetical protein AGMMS49938_03620 [Fibrobacterales bacterium]|nr:hypothetical protein AGMMS49938_03620 [Fibrobacterales bacterium]